MTTRRHYVSDAPQQMLSATCGVGAGTLVISGSFAGWPSTYPFPATINFGQVNEERVLVTNISGTTATITKAQDGSADVSHAVGETFDHTVWGTEIDELNAHANGTSGVHGVSGSVVGTTDAQTVSNKTINSSTLNSPVVNTPTVSGGTTANATHTGDATHPAVVGKATTSGGKTFSGQNSAGVEKASIDDAGNIVTAGGVTATGAVSAASVTATGAVTGGSVSTTGAVSGGSVAATAAVTGASATISGAGSFGSLSVGGKSVVPEPVGMIRAFAGAVAPTGYLVADGSAVSRTTYSDLFAVIGVMYGVGDGSTTFNLPNLKGRVIVGRDTGQTEFDNMGDTGGEKTHVLTTAEIPSHTHAFDANTAAYAGGVGNSIHFGATGTPTNPNYGGNVIKAAGGDGAHNNLQPFITLNYIIKY